MQRSRSPWLCVLEVDTFFRRIYLRLGLWLWNPWPHSWSIADPHSSKSLDRIGVMPYSKRNGKTYIRLPDGRKLRRVIPRSEDLGIHQMCKRSKDHNNIACHSGRMSIRYHQTTIRIIKTFEKSLTNDDRMYWNTKPRKVLVWFEVDIWRAGQISIYESE